MLEHKKEKKNVGLQPALISLLSIAFFNGSSGDDYIQRIKPLSPAAGKVQAIPVIDCPISAE